MTSKQAIELAVLVVLALGLLLAGLNIFIALFVAGLVAALTGEATSRRRP